MPDDKPTPTDETKNPQATPAPAAPEQPAAAPPAADPAATPAPTEPQQPEVDIDKLKASLETSSSKLRTTRKELSESQKQLEAAQTEAAEWKSKYEALETDRADAAKIIAATGIDPVKPVPQGQEMTVERFYAMSHPDRMKWKKANRDAFNELFYSGNQ